jgi:hypothetical protein
LCLVNQTSLIFFAICAADTMSVMLKPKDIEQARHRQIRAQAGLPVVLSKSIAYTCRYRRKGKVQGLGIVLKVAKQPSLAAATRFMGNDCNHVIRCSYPAGNRCTLIERLRQ